MHGYLYNDEEDWNNGAPSFAGNVGVRYEGRKVGFGVEARMQSERRWMLLTSGPASGTDAGPVSVSSFEAPFGVDLRVDFDAGCHDGLEYVHAALRVAAHHTAADIGLTAWTDTFIGLMLRSMTFCTSSSERFVSVTKLPCKKLRR